MSFSTSPPEQSLAAPRTARGEQRAMPYASADISFFTASILLYAGAILLATMTLNAYFAQTWDVNTFIQAAHRFTDGGNPFDLYAQSRAAQTWPYAYPPLHALVVAAGLLIGNALRVLPDYVWTRVPALLADIGVALALYAIVQRKSNDRWLARAAMLLWLFNPVTFYDTAVQGHFESEWILFVLLAYLWFEKSRGFFLPAAALAVAVLFKQVALLFAIPLWTLLILSLRAPQGRSNLLETLGIASSQRTLLAMTLLSLALFALIGGVVSLPFLLYSNDFFYMNLTYLENVPVQTQSWIVGLLGITHISRDVLVSDFFLLRYQTIVTLLATAAIAFFAARRGFDLYLTAALITLAFFLTSKKVMGYYYVMLFPFLFAECLPKRRFDLALIAIVATAWISLSPYFAPWGNPDHWWIYALLGSVNSLLFVWFFVHLWRGDARLTIRGFDLTARLNDARATLFIALGLFAGASFAAFLQPLAPNSGNPIRAPIIAPGAEATVLAAFGALLALTLIAMVMIARWTRDFEGTITRAAWAIVLIFAPLFFSVYYLTKESTAIFEIALKTLGV